MNRFAALLDRLGYEPRRNAKLRLLDAYFRATPDPERGMALAAMTGSLDFRDAKPGLIKALVSDRVDPVLFGLSYNYVGDLADTVALIWPAPSQARPGDEAAGPGHNRPPPPALSEVVEALSSSAKIDLPRQLAAWLDELDETGRWALLKLVTGNLRIGVSARLAKTALAGLGGMEADAVEEVWHGLEPPYETLFAWVEGRGPRPAPSPAPFRPPMLAHPLEDEDFEKLDPALFTAEWKWDGIRVQATAGRDDEGRLVRRLYSRTGEDISPAFPDLLEAIDFEAAIDGELLILREGRVQSFSLLQQRLNRKGVTPKLLTEYPAHIRAYDLLDEGGEDLRALPFTVRRRRLEAFVETLGSPWIDVSPMLPFGSWDELAAARADPAAAEVGADAAAVEGCMIKRADSPYVPGRPKGLWFKWKREPLIVDAVVMYAQRGTGKRSSYYSDYTFGVWRPVEGGTRELVPVGKCYSGFTDQELLKLDRHVRGNTTARFGPVREVAHGEDEGLVLEIAFEGLQRSTRHKSGIAMRFPRVSRIRWDKPPREADLLETLEAALRRIEEGRAAPSPDVEEAEAVEKAGAVARQARNGRK